MARAYINIVCFIALLFQLCALNALGQDLPIRNETDDIGDDDYYYDYPTERPAEDRHLIAADWLYGLLDEGDECDPNPCLNQGRCGYTANGSFICSCPEPYSGKRCQTVKDLCENLKCGHGSCVVKSTAPFYECKCRHPYKPPNCNKASRCRPDPCQNGGSCMTGPRNSSFQCSCPDGYSGKFCEVGPNDCYQDDGEFYHGMVSVTVEEEECLDWNSIFILQKGRNPFHDYAGSDRIGPHNYCRNPDGDNKPWCFINENGQLKWNYCKVRKCSGASATPPTTSAIPDVSAAQFSQCGKPQPSNLTRIFGGKKSLPAAHPWQVSLQKRTNGSSEPFNHICGGILINSCWVLTAGHCILSGMEIQVVLGGVDITKDEISDQFIPVEKAIVHENYTNINKIPHNDIALLKLRVSDSPYCAKETRFVKTACLPDRPFKKREKCVISGWGRTEYKRYGTRHLLDAGVLLISQEKCKAPHIYGNTLDDNMFCAGNLNGGVDSCQGDSGGPLICERNGTHYVVGVVSWGYGCGKKYKPGVYTNVNRFVDWITHHLHA